VALSTQTLISKRDSRTKYSNFEAFIACSALNLSTNPEIFKHWASFSNLPLKHKLPNHVFNFRFRLTEISASLGKAANSMITYLIIPHIQEYNTVPLYQLAQKQKLHQWQRDMIF